MDTTITKLRKIVDNGWTIANRRVIMNSIGEDFAVMLSDLSFRDNLGMDVFEFSQLKSQLIPDNVATLLNALKKRLGVQRSKPRAFTELPQNTSYCISHLDSGGNIDFSRALPEDYVEITRIGKNTLSPLEKAHYYIDRLVSVKNGDGTAKVQSVVERSLRTDSTHGRVKLECMSIDNERPCGAGFYYKLGFRFLNPKYDERMTEWLQQGGKREFAPKLYGDMYLPKENIVHCLTYGYDK